MSDEQEQIPTGAVVVGVDGTERDRPCIDYGAGYASRAGRPLHVLHARDSGVDYGTVEQGNARTASIRGDAETRAFEALLAGIRTQWPEVAVTGSEPDGRAERVLIDASTRAHIVVLGSHETHGFQRLLGRNSLASAMHARCPVALVPDGAVTSSDGPVVVAIDGSDHSRVALEQAISIADLRGAPLKVVTTWHVEVVDGAVVTSPGTPAWDAVMERYRASAEALVAPLREHHPRTEVHIEVLRGSPAPTIVEAAAGASLLVVGTRGRGGFRGMLLGSVSQRVLETATCPVMVVPSGRD